MQKLKSAYLWVKAKDEVAPAAASKLHFNTNIGQKTFIGGLLSWMVSSYVLYIAYSKGRQMLEYGEPNTKSIAEQMNYQEVGKVDFNLMSRPLLEIQQGGDTTIDLDAIDYRQYFHVRVNNIRKKFNEHGKEIKTNSYYQISRCQKSQFQNDEYYQNYWEAFGERAQYCLVTDEVYLQGTRDSPLNKQDSAYIVWEFHKCSEKTMLPGYPACADPKDIESFLEDKKISFKIINQKIDFNERGPKAFRFNEVFVQTIEMKAGKFSDTGHRYRFNQFHRIDHWWTKNVKKDPFYDYVFYNSDTYDVPKEKSVIAEVYFRLDSDQITHHRVVFAIMDFFGALGGVSRVLLQICGLFFGGYAQFWSAFATNGLLYKIKSNKELFKKSKKTKGNIQTMKVPLRTRIALFSHLSCFSPLIRCCMTKNHKQLLNIYKECSIKTKKDLDLVNILEKQRKCIHDIKMMKKRLQLENDSIFEIENQDGIFEFELTPRATTACQTSFPKENKPKMGLPMEAIIEEPFNSCRRESGEAQYDHPIIWRNQEGGSPDRSHNQSPGLRSGCYSKDQGSFTDIEIRAMNLSINIQDPIQSIIPIKHCDEYFSPTNQVNSEQN